MMDILTGYRDKSVRNRISGVAVRLATVRTPKLGRRGRVIGAGWGGGRSIYSGGGGVKWVQVGIIMGIINFNILLADRNSNRMM